MFESSQCPMALSFGFECNFIAQQHALTRTSNHFIGNDFSTTDPAKSSAESFLAQHLRARTTPSFLCNSTSWLKALLKWLCSQTRTISTHRTAGNLHFGPLTDVESPSQALQGRETSNEPSTCRWERAPLLSHGTRQILGRLLMPNTGSLNVNGQLQYARNKVLDPG